jgi:hypothetical protein
MTRSCTRAIWQSTTSKNCSSPFWSRIGKCANPVCKRYFLRKRQRKTPIKRGSYCGSCKLIGGAERTRLSRERLKREMLAVAAQAWQE